MWSLVILAIALSMDAFAVSIGLGTKHAQNKFKIAIACALYFGFFQGIMPSLGYALGQGALQFAADYMSWIAAIVLMVVALKMFYESIFIQDEHTLPTLNNRTLLILGLATSIDAMAAGFAVTVLETGLLWSCMVIGICTCFLSYLGVLIGAQSGSYFERKAELLGAVILGLMSVRIMFL